MFKAFLLQYSRYFLVSKGGWQSFLKEVTDTVTRMTILRSHTVKFRARAKIYNSIAVPEYICN